MPIVRTALLITALLLSWVALRVEGSAHGLTPGPVSVLTPAPVSVLTPAPVSVTAPHAP